MSGVKGLLAVLVVAAGLGGFNYYRNLQADAARPRPFAAYSVAQLEALIQAYESEVDGLSDRYEARRGERAEQRGGALLDERVGDFDRASRHASRRRALAGDLSEKEASLRDLRSELASRSEGPWALHLRRLLTI